ARAREARGARALGRAGVAVRAAEAALVQAPGTITTAGGGAYQVYSAYARVWEGLDAPTAVPAPRQWVAASALRGIGVSVPDVPAGFELPPSGEDAARKRLDAFLRDRVRRYPETRDLPGLDATSRLSPHLRWGTIPGAAALRRARAAAVRDPSLREGVRVWTRELPWRDFYAQLLLAHPPIA